LQGQNLVQNYHIRIQYRLFLDNNRLPKALFLTARIHMYLFKQHKNKYKMKIEKILYHYSTTVYCQNDFSTISHPGTTCTSFRPHLGNPENYI
jgi:hypothetical protein